MKFLVLLALITCSGAITQELSLHESLAENRGNSFIFRKAIPDASVFPLGDVIRGCQTLGSSWRAYSMANYLGRSRHIGPTACNGSEYMIDAKSFRYVGNLDTEVDAVSLYPATSLRGEEIYIGHSPFGGITAKVASLGWSGRSAWTLFEGINFQGKSVCLPARNGVTGGIDSLSFSFNMTTVGSLMKGCHTVVTAELRETLLRTAQYF